MASFFQSFAEGFAGSFKGFDFSEIQKRKDKEEDVALLKSMQQEFGSVDENALRESQNRTAGFQSLKSLRDALNLPKTMRGPVVKAEVKRLREGANDKPPLNILPEFEQMILSSNPEESNILMDNITEAAVADPEFGQTSFENTITDPEEFKNNMVPAGIQTAADIKANEKIKKGEGAGSGQTSVAALDAQTRKEIKQKNNEAIAAEKKFTAMSNSYQKNLTKATVVYSNREDGMPDTVLLMLERQKEKVIEQRGNAEDLRKDADDLSKTLRSDIRSGAVESDINIRGVEQEKVRALREQRNRLEIANNPGSLQLVKLQERRAKIEDELLNVVPGSSKEKVLDRNLTEINNLIKKDETKETFTSTQRLAAMFAVRMQSANKTIKELGGQFTGTTSRFVGIVPQGLKFEDRQLFDQAVRNFINATLRRESGAAINPSEFVSANLQYIPVPGNTEAVLAQKTLNRQQIQFANALEAGNAFKELQDALADASAKRTVKVDGKDVEVNSEVVFGNTKFRVEQDGSLTVISIKEEKE